MTLLRSPTVTFAAVLPTLLAMLSSSAALAARWPDVSTPASTTKIGKDDVVLVAGVGKPFVLPEIPGAADVATDWYRFFVDGRGVPVDRAVLLRDTDVTKESLLAEAERLRGLRRGQGTFWLIFVGHGAPSTSGNDGLLLGVDVQPTIRSIESRGLAQRELLHAAGGDEGVPIVAVFDACFSGVGSDGSGRPLVPGSQATLPVRRAPPPKRVTVLQASEAVAGPLPGHNRPAFSYLLLGAVRGWADDDGDGSVKVAEAFAWVKKTITTTVRDRSQIPSLVGPADVVWSRGARERAPNVDTGRRIVDTPRAPAEPRREREVALRAPAADTFDRVAAEEAFTKRRLGATSSGFVRGAYATAVDEARVVETGQRYAPEAAKVITDVSGRHNVGVVGGVGVGAATALVAGSAGAYVLSNGGSEIGLGVVGGFLGGLLGITAGVLTGVALAPSEADEARLSSARSDLADAVNTEERRRLGLGGD